MKYLFLCKLSYLIVFFLLFYLNFLYFLCLGYGIADYNFNRRKPYQFFSRFFYGYIFIFHHHFLSAFRLSCLSADCTLNLLSETVSSAVYICDYIVPVCRNKVQLFRSKIFEHISKPSPAQSSCKAYFFFIKRD